MRHLFSIIFVLILALVSSARADTSKNMMQIELHTFWVSKGEQAALQSLTRRMERLNVHTNIVVSSQYNDLRHTIANRIGLGYPPEITHWLGGESLERLISENSRFLNPDFSNRDFLRDAIYPEVIEEISVNDKIYAIPVGIHLQSSAIYNMELLAQAGVTEIPTEWSAFYEMVEKLERASILPFAGTSELWVNRELFNGILTSLGERAALNNLYGNFDTDGTLLAQLVEAMKLFTKFRDLAGEASRGRKWDDMVKMVVDGEAAMTVVGDYAWSEIKTYGTGDLTRFKCASLPGLRTAYFGVDIFIAFETTLPGWREKYPQILETILEPETQYEYLQYKGGISIVKDLDSAGLNPCSRASLDRWNQVPNQRFSTPGTRDKNSTALVNSALIKILADNDIGPQQAAELIYNTVKNGQ